MSLIILGHQFQCVGLSPPPQEILQDQLSVLWFKSDTTYLERASDPTGPTRLAPPPHSDDGHGPDVTRASDQLAVNWGTMIPSLDLNVLPEPLTELKRIITS